VVQHLLCLVDDFSRGEAGEGRHQQSRFVVRGAGSFVRDKRSPSQFDDKGLQKLELVRTNSFSYSAFNLEALTQLAVIVAPAGVDLYATKPGIVAGLDALLPYDAKHPWPHEQISAGKEDAICPALGRVAAHTHDPKYAEAWTRFDCKATADSTVESLTK